MNYVIDFSIVLTLLHSLSITAQTNSGNPSYVAHSCPNTTTFMTNSTYQANLNNLLTTLSSNANNFAGGEPDHVYGLFLCRGDVSIDVCQDCVTFATQDITELCPIEKEAVVWYDDCLLRYSNRSFFSTVDTSPMFYLPSEQNISSDKNGFNNLLATTINDAAAKASGAPSGAKKFAVEEANFTRGFRICINLAQCTPDLSSSNCARCLGDAISNLPTCCDGKQGGRVLTPNCNIRYEVYPFYDASAEPPPSASPAGSEPTPQPRGKVNIFKCH